MNLNQLTYFVTLAQIENYTKRLDITQPSLSHAISNLEKELQVPLFERHGRNVTMTKYGEMFLKYVQDSLHILNLGVERIQEAARIPGGSISIGYIHTQGRRFIPELVRGFLNEQEGKKIDFHFQNAATGTLIRGLKEEKFDVIFCSRAEGEKEISFVPVAEEKLVAVVPEDHALAGKNTVTIEELGQYPQVTFTPTSGLYFVVRELFEKEGIVPETAFEVEEDGGRRFRCGDRAGCAGDPYPACEDLKYRESSLPPLHIHGNAEKPVSKFSCRAVSGLYLQALPDL